MRISDDATKLFRLVLPLAPAEKIMKPLRLNQSTGGGAKRAPSLIAGCTPSSAEARPGREITPSSGNGTDLILATESLERRTTRLPWLTLLVLTAFGCGSNPSTVDTRAADEAAIREADIAMAKAGEAKDLAELMTYYVDEADVPMFLPPGAPIRVGREQIAQGIARANENTGFSITWHPVQVEVARSGDLGVVRGTYETTIKAPDGTVSMDKGKYIEIWKKQSDGTWKVLMDIANSDLPTTGTPL